MKENNSFIAFDSEKVGELFSQVGHKEYPIAYYHVVNGVGLRSQHEKSYYIYVYEGDAVLTTEGRPEQNMRAGMYLSVSSFFSLRGYFKAIVIEVFQTFGNYGKTGFKCMFNLGGPIEKQGRLKYIDGCTDSLLIAPVKKGDPCFNHLHFPKNIDQTPHTHPSHRIGIVARGHGECITPFGNLPLTEGMIFVIKEWDGDTHGTGLDGKVYPTGTHSFKTTDSHMDVIAFHPDSDFGATDEVHPMINRTMVDGISASKLKDIRTK